ncbi:hypothetical protein BO71DRAFT_338874 [Aspergillus ellipticus CBS 707.79]|uniref:Uncharacterized protein n=1 Tax=Aspergillus ellipticus CBS 707.79 TaxID=1448320 RepID=A0A319CUK3_9EURO|nr:hypothetical protein BO71DRAFT_338874 [Aspergillus ellipticus CBS 707.79]
MNIHHPLDAASYYFKDTLVSYLDRRCHRENIIIHVETREDSGLHIGNLTTFVAAFALAAVLKQRFGRNVRVRFVYTPASGDECTIGGVRYQRHALPNGVHEVNPSPFMRVVRRISEFFGIPFDTATQSLWRDNPEFSDVLQAIVAKLKSCSLTSRLVIRAPCPQCGLMDKRGTHSCFDDDGHISFDCPRHGQYAAHLHDPREWHRLNFNAPFRNLLRVILCSRDKNNSWILCAGAHYGGFYQDQLMWRFLDNPDNAPPIFYSPLIVDSSGGRLSESLFRDQDPYDFHFDFGLEYMISVFRFLGRHGGLEALCREVHAWMEEPHRLFRNYSMQYIDTQLRRRGMTALQR